MALNLDLSSITNFLNKLNRYTFIKLARVMRIDEENLVADIVWLQHEGGPDEVPLTVPFASPRSFIGGIPEEGATAIVSYTQASHDLGAPIIIGWLPAGFKGGMYQHKHSIASIPLESTESFYIPSFRRYHRKLYSGEIGAWSADRSELILSNTVQMQDQKDDEILLNPHDRSINLNSVQTYIHNDAVRISSGMVARYYPQLIGTDGAYLGHKNSKDEYTGLADFDSTNTSKFIDERGLGQWVVTLSGTKTINTLYDEKGNINTLKDSEGNDILDASNKTIPDLSSVPLVEHRLEVRELGHTLPALPWQMFNYDGWDIDNNKSSKKFRDRYGSIIETSMGTVVGHDYTFYPETYGKPVRPQIFTSPFTSNIDVKEITVNAPTDDPNYSEIRLLPAAYMFKMPYYYAGTRMYISKEGQIFLHTGASHAYSDIAGVSLNNTKEYPLGAGRSIEANIGGSIKAIIDKNVDQEESLDLKTMGRVHIHLGKDDNYNSSVSRSLLVDKKLTIGANTSVKALLQRSDLLKTPAENNSAIIATDGGIVARIGKNLGLNERNYPQNGLNAVGDTDQAEYTVRTNRAFYGTGDYKYTFPNHDISKAGGGAPGRLMTKDPTTQEDVELPIIKNPNLQATSIDAHICGSTFFRIGDDIDDKSIGLDTRGAIIAWIGSEKANNRSVIATMDGGLELNLGKISSTGNSIQAMISGGIDIDVKSGGDHNDINVRCAGSQLHSIKGDKTVSMNGSETTQIMGNQNSTILGSSTISVMKTLQRGVMGSYNMTIGNTNLSLDAYKVSAWFGNINRQVETVGMIRDETRVGNILYQTLMGSAEFRSVVGQVIIEALAGITKVHGLQVELGVPILPKFGVMTALSPCLVLGIPHALGSTTVKASL